MGWYNTLIAGKYTSTGPGQKKRGRPAVEPVVRFCERKGIRLHGHTLVWGNNSFQTPEWLIDQLPPEVLPLVRREPNPVNGTIINEATASVFGDLSAEEFDRRYPEFTNKLNELTARRIVEIAMRYGDRIDSWDIVNESSSDFEEGRLIPDSRLCKSWYGPMPGGYPYRALKLAEAVLPRKALFNINDYHLEESYADETLDLLKRGCRLDVVGAQMHLFNPAYCLDIADGTSDRQSPRRVRGTLGRLERTGKPVHLREITITAPPTGDGRGEDIQAMIARNLYRLWFSLKPTMGITWWNVVDDCGAPGEPAVSGLFHRDMTPKQSFYSLDDLIRREWRTDLAVKAGKDGTVEFRGFRGNYRLSWEDAAGTHFAEVELA